MTASNDTSPFDTCKRCLRCKEHKPLAQFHKDKCQRDGIARYCKICSSLMGGHKPRVERTIPDGYKRCTRGDNCIDPQGATQPATSDHYHKNRSTRDGWDHECRACQKIRSMKYRQENSEKLKEWQKRYYQENLERVKERNHRSYRKHAAERLEYGRRYFEAHREQTYIRKRRYLHEHPELRRRANKKFRERHPERVKELRRLDYQKHRERYRASNHNRRAKEYNLPATFTRSQYRYSVVYFQGVCTYCGKSPKEGAKLHADHFIPLADAEHCPGTVVTNMLPACANCNHSKCKTDPRVWLLKRFGQEESQAILQRIDVYFEEVRADKQTSSS